MWTGVTRGLAGMKFSESPKRKGFISAKDINAHNNTINPKRSFSEKYG